MSELLSKVSTNNVGTSSIQKLWHKVICAGVLADQDVSFIHKLKARNTLSFLCSVFSLTYVFYFAKELQVIPLAAITVGILVFCLSIILNHQKKYKLSGVLLLLNTNYCVLFFSIYLGFDSGIHLYLFTSPLIVLTLFEIGSCRFLFFAMSSYIINFIVILFIEKYIGFHVLNLEEKTQSIFYLVNFSFCIFLVVALTLHFYQNNRKINQLLVLKNRELELQQIKLIEENKIRKQTEEQAKHSLAHKEILLSEIHHRVKNNLAVISGLLDLQGFFIKDTNTLDAIKSSQSRIKSMALLHEKLYENKTLEKVNIRLYVDELLSFIQQSFSNEHKQITVHPQIVGNVDLKMTEATAFALIINELICNSYKHAFPTSNSGNIFITFMNYNGEYLLTYNDDGIGYTPPNTSEMSTLGLNLIDSFCTQLNGKYEFVNKKGVTFNLKFAEQLN